MKDNTTIPLTPSQRLWRLLKPDHKEISNIYVYSIFNGLVALSVPLGIQAIVNLIQGGQISTSWMVLVFFVVLGVAITGVLQIFQLRITENLQQKIFARAAFDFAYRIPRIRMEALYKHYAPELMNRFFDIVAVQKGLSKILIDFSTATLHIIFGLILLAFYHSFFILFGVILILLIYVIFQFTAKRGLNTSLKESEHKYRLVHWLEELARTSTTFKLAGKTDLPLQRTDAHVGDYLIARESHFRVLVQQYSLLVVFKVIIATGLLAIGGVLVMDQQMNVGQFIAAEIIILLVMTSVEKLIVSLENIYDVLTALEKIGQVTDLELEQKQGIKLKEVCEEKGIKVELDKVSFNYPNNHRKVLEGLTLSIESGEVLLIAGANGSGKSTLLHILAGLYDVQAGSISYNGLPKGNLELSSLRDVIGDCLTQEELFEGTVLENITMGREAATFNEVQRVVEKLGLSSFIKNSPKGYDTILDPQGKKLSSSIAQKLLLARSIAHKPKLLLLEDAFEPLDEQDRKKIIDFLTSKENKWTTVAVSSNSYLAKCSNRIAIMKDGVIYNSGSYEEMKNIANFKTNNYA